MKTVFVKLRVSPEERDEWNAKAKRAGMSLSDLIRRSFGRVKSMTITDRSIERTRNIQIQKVGNNLNQIARWANTYKTEADAVEVIEHLKAIEDELKKLKPDAH